ncbi:MAG: aspartyl/asparaginyl beta-hydroxylase domain-containing protein [Chlamydiales bacterium]|nr:aspartyl/asparaginyl beta-hydroxylase domain-containing protein [Chlamydiales bacterium]
MEQPFYDLALYPDLQDLTRQYSIIVDELKQNQTWINWGSDRYDPTGHCKFLTGSWTVCPIYFGNFDPNMVAIPGMKLTEVRELIASLPTKFPETTKLFQKIPSLNYCGFSRLHPHSNLAPHKHVNSAALIYHLGLIIPPGHSCGLKVGDQTHTWTKPGDAVVFDDTLEHSAWNNSDQERIILYVDFVADKKQD